LIAFGIFICCYESTMLWRSGHSLRYCTGQTGCMKHTEVLDIFGKTLLFKRLLGKFLWYVIMWCSTTFQTWKFLSFCAFLSCTEVFLGDPLGCYVGMHAGIVLRQIKTLGKHLNSSAGIFSAWRPVTARLRKLYSCGRRPLASQCFTDFACCDRIVPPFDLARYSCLPIFSAQRLHGFRQVVQHVQLHVANWKQNL
jgi:hypothetical protein